MINLSCGGFIFIILVCYRVHMPRVSYLRLDGSVPASSRNGVVTKFNNDPSIDVLLLTTQVGGLGLNLTGADTVSFVYYRLYLFANLVFIRESKEHVKVLRLKSWAQLLKYMCVKCMAIMICAVACLPVDGLRTQILD